MDQGTYPAHFSAAEGDPRGREAGQDNIGSAVQILEVEHAVGQMSAYAMLVQAAVDSRSSVRERAARLVADTRGAA